MSRPGLVLHIGTGKTGTSSIQQFLRINRPRLARRAILYPHAPGRARHTQLGFFVKTEAELARIVEWTRAGHGDLDAFRADFERRLTTEISEAAPKRVIMSDEALYSLSDEALLRLRSLAERIADRVRVIVYLRRQDDHLVSRYQQAVKTGATETLAEFARLDHTPTYDYAARLTTWQQVVRPDQLVVRRFEPSRFGAGGLYQDFLDAAAIKAPLDRFKPVESQNESLDAEAVELLRILNLYRVEHEGAVAGVINNRPLFTRLGADGPTLTLADDEFTRFMGQWTATNRQVAATYFAGDELFGPRRASRSTTTDQRLDPARLDHYFELLEIPAEQQAAVRAIAEREAAR
ncbi:hypothetical protein HNR19_001449 [Nocardioides thalensis]|uniref:Sulfotransferase family protein n=1 Tax=Nocardioides thalensis TaxID=1914755 RepID=A0A853C0N4_9ACTN|nr:hypothetical protein [Nocardioides thalensis]NYJ00751.1 hypothetical protein [Nocardioides thalensis]